MTGRIEALISEPTPELVQELEGLVRRIIDDLDAGRDCDALIARIDAQAGAPGYGRETFAELHGWTSARDFAERAALGRPPSIPDLTVQEVAECLRIIETAEQPRSDFCLTLLGNSFPHIPVTDMIFHPKEALPSDALAAEIVRRGRETGPILL